MGTDAARVERHDSGAIEVPRALTYQQVDHATHLGRKDSSSLGSLHRVTRSVVVSVASPAGRAAAKLYSGDLEGVVAVVDRVAWQWSGDGDLVFSGGLFQEGPGMCSRR